jgi:DNA-binding MarR family transcriptional regulator
VIVVVAGDVTAGAVARRRMTSGELAIWRSLLDTTAELRRVLGAQLQDSGLSPADYQVLLALTEADGRRLRSSQLAASIDWERSRLSHHLGRMERRGLIGRSDCATDNRGAEVSLTEDGARIFRCATAPHLRAIKMHFADALTPVQFEALADILHALRDHLHGEQSAARASGDPS